MNLEKLKDAARKFEQKEDWRRAIEVYQKAIVEFESGQDPNPDLSIYNRVGDLHMKANDPTAAVQAYERAVDLYSDQGFLNNAIALCGKILRVNPGRIQAYLKLAQLHARKNVVVDAKKNLIEYLERMNQVHQLDEAFKAVKAFADQFPGNQEIRFMLSDLLRASSRTTEAREQLQKLTADLEAKGDTVGARKTRERLQAIDELPAAVAPSAPKRGDLVFLDIGVEVRPPSSRPAAAPVVPPRRSTVRTARPTVRTTPVIPPEAMIDDTMIVIQPPDSDDTASDTAEVAPLEIETSSLADTDLDLASLAAITPNPDVPDLLRPDDVIAPEAGLDLEPTSFDVSADELPGVSLDGLEMEPSSGAAGEQPASLLDDNLTISPSDITPVEGVERDFGTSSSVPGEEDLLVLDSVPDDGDSLAADDTLALEPEEGGVVLDAEEDTMVMEEAPAEVLLSDVTIETSGEVLDDGTDWEIPDDADDQLLASTAPKDGTAEAALSFLQVDEPVQPSIEELEDRILDDPDNPENHRSLGEALLASGDAVRGVDELDLALLSYENREDWEHALDLISELIRVDPASVRYYQKRVEVAYRTGEKPRLIDAYLELGDALVRSGALDKALAVYRRVIEHEPENPRAGSALMALAPPEETAPAPAKPASGTAAPKRAEPASDEDSFVDLGSLVMEEDRIRDTRMRIEDEEPTGDEEQDFKEMLSQFKRGIEQNLDADDFQSHYDLGVAFKEMGLLDEAIAEFQKALRSPEGRLRTSEALGVCFYEKGQHPIAEAILRRAIDSQPGADDQKIGLLYWLARSLETQAKVEDSLITYRRIMAVDIRFADVGERMSQLNAGRTG
ncbi:MAG: tetratricopeptide repeat protein [Gemmatimonadota bacterium]